MPLCSQLSGVRFYRNGQWVSELQDLLQASPARSSKKRLPKLKIPRSIRNWSLKHASRGHVFHGPNFFLPAWAENGVITVHDLSVFKFPDTHPVERIQQFERDFSRSVKQALHIITDSQTTRLELIAYAGLAPEKVSAVPLGVSTQFTPVSSVELVPVLQRYGLHERPYALCVSTLEPRKKLPQLLTAWAKLPQDLRNNFMLVLIGGDGWLSEALRSQIDHAQSQGWLKRLGYVPEQDLPHLISGASLFVYPSTYEGFGLPPIEAMACGVPVLVSDQSCLPEITKGAAAMTNPDDANAFCVSLEKALTDEAWRLEAKERGLAVALSYTWERCVDETVAVYQKISS
ncbi:glycosyltransferase family 4 protein [Variovorax sp. PCZ-1]|nr:glycosyltransferase family 4 protein [Variovorax sp. PCZ-1]